MPILEKYENNIYEDVVVLLKDDKTFAVYNTRSCVVICNSIKDAEYALMIKKAYCDGFYDGENSIGGTKS